MANTKTMTMTNKPKNTFSGVTMTKNPASSAEAKTLKPVYISLVKVIAIALLDFSVKNVIHIFYIRYIEDIIDIDLTKGGGVGLRF